MELGEERGEECGTQRRIDTCEKILIYGRGWVDCKVWVRVRWMGGLEPIFLVRRKR